MKRKIRYMAYSAIYTARIHANVLCRLRFLAIKGHYKAGILAGTSQMVPYMQISLFAASGRL